MAQANDRGDEGFGPVAGMGSERSLFRSGLAQAQIRSRSIRHRRRRVPRPLSRQTGRTVGRRTCRRDRRLRKAGRHARPRGELCLALLRGGHERSRARAVLSEHPGTDQRYLDRAVVLRPRNQPHRGCGARGKVQKRGAGALSAVAARRPRLPSASIVGRSRKAAARKVRCRCFGVAASVRRNRSGAALSRSTARS